MEHLDFVEIKVKFAVDDMSKRDLFSTLVLQKRFLKKENNKKKGSIKMHYLTKCMLGCALSAKYNKHKDQLYLLVWGHIGEAVYTLSLLPELARIKKKKINIITFAPYDQIAELYADFCEKIIVLPKMQLYYILNYSKSHLCTYKNYIGKGWEWDENDLYLDVPNIYMPGLNYKIKDLKIPYSTKHSLITNPVSPNEKEFVQLVNSLGVKKGRSVLFIPYARSQPEMPDAFWGKLAQTIQQAGYKVYTNVKDDTEKPIQGTIAAKIPLKYAITFVQYAGSAISIRCGLTDLLAVSDSDVEVLYKIEKDADAVIAKICSFKLGEENLLFKKSWLLKNSEDEKRFEDYIQNKYR